jgi:hypothetical protein
MMRLSLLALLASAGCIKSSATTCGDGHVCSPDRVCDEIHETCVFPDQLTSCQGMPDGTACSINRVPGGICKDMVCIPATCGDELVANGEVCDGADDIPDVGTCVDFAYDYGSLTCSELCTEGFDQCRRLGWQLRALSGGGRIGGIWEDGSDLWLANQGGVYRRRAGAWDPLIQPTGSAVWYHAIWAGGGHAFAVGNDGSVAHFDGTTWTSESVANGLQLFAVWGSSPTEVYVAGGKSGSSGGIWRYDGTSWSEMILPSGTPMIRGLWGTGGDVFAVGLAGTILRRTNAGLSWTVMGSPTSHDLMSVWGVSANTVFAVGNPPSTQPNGTAVILRMSSGVWTQMQIPPNTNELNAISGRSLNEIFAVGSRDGSNILYFDGVAWSPMVSTVSGGVLGLNAVYAGANGVYAAKRPSVFLEYGEAGWVEAPAAQSTIRGIWAAGPDYAIAVGDGLEYQEYNAGGWGSVPYPPCWGATNFVFDVWGAAQRDVWIVGPYGKMLHKTPLGLQCVDAPNAPKWIADVWGSGSDDVFAVGADGQGTEPNLLHFDGTAWSDWSDRVRPLAKTLSGVWGFSATDVFVTGDTKVLRYDGSMWRDTGLVTTHNLHAVWGSSATNVFAVGEAGAIFRFDGTTWTQMVVPFATTTPTNEAWRKVHGTGPNDVYVAGSRTLLRYDGTAWAPIARPVPTSVEAVFTVPGTVFSGGEGGVDARLIGRLQ